MSIEWFKIAWATKVRKGASTSSSGFEVVQRSFKKLSIRIKVSRISSASEIHVYSICLYFEVYEARISTHFLSFLIYRFEL